MQQKITLVIPTHNRHRYLQRVLKFYANSGIAIIVGDSTLQPLNPVPSNISYLHLPGLSLPEKLKRLTAEVKTQYTVLCADDDFIITGSIFKCLDFLEQHSDYAVAQGRIICYNKEALLKNEVNFSVIYKEDVIENNEEDPLVRLKKLFAPYHAFFYGVHRTENLRDAFSKNTKELNLFLNEFLTGIIPLYRGKSIELPVLYQVREYSLVSDDKTTTGLFHILNNDQYKNQYDQYLENICEILSQKEGGSRDRLKATLHSLLCGLSDHFEELNSNAQKVSVKKRVGRLVNFIPVIGKKIVSKSRAAERNKQINEMIRTEEDKQALAYISVFLLENRWAVLPGI
ncbi:MAG: TIGR00180 family glycosyltransferase [Niabella sp.]